MSKTCETCGQVLPKETPEVGSIVRHISSRAVGMVKSIGDKAFGPDCLHYIELSPFRGSTICTFFKSVEVVHGYIHINQPGDTACGRYAEDPLI